MGTDFPHHHFSQWSLIFFNSHPSREEVYSPPMVFTFHHVRWLLAIALMPPVLTSCATQSAPTPAQVGHWEGNARIIVSWCRQKNLPVKVDIHADGSVTGSVGDAKLSEGRFQRNRGWLGRKLNLATDYIITGDLDGPIVAAEAITRQRVMMPLDFSGDAFTGGLGTSGWMFGGKDKMVFTATSLTLTHSQ
jgi:hypothetical protein